MIFFIRIDLIKKEVPYYKRNMTIEHINKSAFDNLKSKKFSSRIDFMSEILKLFCIDRAKMKNGSFSYFVENYV